LPGQARGEEEEETKKTLAPSIATKARAMGLVYTENGLDYRAKTAAGKKAKEIGSATTYTPAKLGKQTGAGPLDGKDFCFFVGTGEQFPYQYGSCDEARGRSTAIGGVFFAKGVRHRDPQWERQGLFITFRARGQRQLRLPDEPTVLYRWRLPWRTA